MLKNKHLLFLIVLLFIQTISSQSIEIFGKIESKIDIENIHVINKTSEVFVITNASGAFNITVKMNDTLMFSSVLHKPKEIMITKEIITSKVVFIQLVEQINELDEVLIGKVLTGDLLLDIQNTEGDPPINFYDVGIPGYTGKIATQSERRLHEAGEFKPKILLGLLGGGLPLNPILNGISGRTKMLKARVELEEKETLMQNIKARLSKDFFVSNPLDDYLIMDFFYYCADDENFIKHCKNKTDFKILIFLRMKYQKYMHNLNIQLD
jgi:hypothetical protein